MLLLLVLSGCAQNATSQSPESSSTEPETSSSSSEPAEPLDLTGTWEQANGDFSFGYHRAVINGDTITIYWIDDDAETESLYWAGTFTAPTEPGDTWAWTSVNDHEQTDYAMLASTDDTKDFAYEDGQIVYKASALGTTKTIRLERV